MRPSLLLPLLLLAAACDPGGKAPVRPGEDTDASKDSATDSGKDSGTDSGTDSDEPRGAWCDMQLVSVAGDVAVTDDNPELKVLFDLPYADKAGLALVDLDGTDIPLFRAPLNDGAGVSASPATALARDAVYFWSVKLPCGGATTVEPFYVDFEQDPLVGDKPLTGIRTDPEDATVRGSGALLVEGSASVSVALDGVVHLRVSAPVNGAVSVTTGPATLEPEAWQALNDLVEAFAVVQGDTDADLEIGGLPLDDVAGSRGLALSPVGTWSTTQPTEVALRFTGPKGYTHDLGTVTVEAYDPCVVAEVLPASGATGVGRTPVITARFDYGVPADTSITLRRGGTTVATEGAKASGRDFQAVPTAPLAPGVAYEISVSACGRTTKSTFTTAGLGAAVAKADLVGRGWIVDLSKGSVVYPPGLGSLLSGLLSGTDLALLVTASSGASSEVTLGLSTVDAGPPAAPLECAATSLVGSAPISQNVVSVGPATITIPVAGSEVALHDVKLTVIAAAGGGTIEVSRLEATIDFRDLDADLLDQLGGSSDPQDVCNLVVTFGMSCEPCATDGRSFCARMAATGLSGTRVSPDPVIRSLSAVYADTGDCPDGAVGCEGATCDSTGLMPKELAFVLLGLLGWRLRRKDAEA